MEKILLGVREDMDRDGVQAVRSRGRRPPVKLLRAETLKAGHDAVNRPTDIPRRCNQFTILGQRGHLWCSQQLSDMCGLAKMFVRVTNSLEAQEKPLPLPDRK